MHLMGLCGVSLGRQSGLAAQREARGRGGQGSRRSPALSAAPLKGIPKQAPFRSPTAPSVFSPAGNRTPIPPSRTPLRKERGVKVGTSPLASAASRDCPWHPSHGG